MTVVELYKILRVKQVDGSKEIVLYDPEGASVQLWDTIKDERLNSIMKRISQELKQIERLKDKEQRRKAIKAMYLKWHPDKSPHPLAKEAFQFLQYQIKRLDQGLPLEDPEHREQHDIPNPFWDKEFQGLDELVHIVCEAQKSELESFIESHSSSLIDRAMDSCQMKPDQSKAKIWLEQAEYDLKALHVLVDSRSSPQELNAHVCFMGNQVAEKALKAGMYTLIGLQQVDLIHHDIMDFAMKIEASSSVDGLTTAAKSLNHGIYLDTRYPNRHGSSHAVPSLQFTRDRAIECKESAEKLLKTIRILVQQNRTV